MDRLEDYPQPVSEQEETLSAFFRRLWLLSSLMASAPTAPTRP